MPSALRPAPPRATTPLPGSFTLTEDASTQAFDGGTVLLGGSPLRLFRISERAQPAGRALAGRGRCGAAPAGTDCWRAGWSRPAHSAPSRPRRALGPGDVTVVVPVRDRPAQLDRLLDALGRVWPASWSTTRRPMRAPPRRSPSATVPPSSGSGDQRRTGRRAQRRAGRSCTARSSRSSTPTACRPRRGSGRCSATSTTPWWLRWRRASCAPRLAGPSATRRRVRRSTGAPREGPVRPGSRIPFVPERGAAGPGRRGDRARPVRPCACAAARTWTWCGVWARPAGTCATSRRARSRTRARRRCEEFLARRAFYGTTAAPLARRHGEAVAPAAPLRLVAGGVEPRCWPVGPCSLWPRCRRPSPSWPAVCADSCATRSAWRRTSRAVARRASALPALASLTRAWSPAFVLGLAFRRTRARRGAGPGRPRARRMGRRPAGARPGARRRRPRGRRCRLRHGRLGRLRTGADVGAAHPSDRLACPRAGRHRLCARSWSRHPRDARRQR